jgi:predicted nucleotidyltransferase component of viral defense system
MQSILSENQKNILQLLGNEKSIADHFYFGGGTALAEFYLQHRLSEDLDFFSEHEFEPQDISIVLKKIKKSAGIVNVEYIQSFNRSLFFLKLKQDASYQKTAQQEMVKTEFTYFPFPRIEKKMKTDELYVDSLLDIAVNKIFTIYQKPRSRDFIDLYCILQKEKSWTLDDLVKKAQIKFDNHLDPIQLGTQYLKVQELKDYPKMIITIDERVWQNFFLTAAKKLKDSIIST